MYEIPETTEEVLENANQNIINFLKHIQLNYEI